VDVMPATGSLVQMVADPTPAFRATVDGHRPGPSGPRWTGPRRPRRPWQTQTPLDRHVELVGFRRAASVVPTGGQDPSPVGVVAEPARSFTRLLRGDNRPRPTVTASASGRRAGHPRWRCPLWTLPRSASSWRARSAAGRRDGRPSAPEATGSPRTRRWTAAARCSFGGHAAVGVQAGSKVSLVASRQRPASRVPAVGDRVRS